MILCSIPDGNPFYEKLIQGILSSANAHSYHVIYTQGPLDKGTFPRFIELIRKVPAAGVILLNHVRSELLLELIGVVPFIQCSEFNSEIDFPYVSIDDRKAARTATEYLIARGRNKVAFINGPLTFKYARERKKGYLDAIEEAHLTIPRNWAVDLPENNYETMIKEYMKSKTKKDFAIRKILQIVYNIFVFIWQMLQKQWFFACKNIVQVVANNSRHFDEVVATSKTVKTTKVCFKIF